MLGYFTENNFFIRSFYTISILYRHFLPKGEPISAHLLCCGPCNWTNLDS